MEEAKEAPKPRPQGDPLETGAAAWQERASYAACNWSGRLNPHFLGVDLTACLEYAFADALNRRYMENLDDREAGPADTR